MSHPSLETSGTRPLRRTGTGFWALLAALAGILGVGAYAYTVQLSQGLAVTELGDEVVWGVYVAGFLFFLGIAATAALISAVLRLSRVRWRGAVTRPAELVTVAALLVAALLPIADLGRPDRLVNLVRFAAWESPILWDVFALATFLTAGLVYLYLGLIPDLAVCRDRLDATVGAPKRWFYRTFSVGWHAFPAQRRQLAAALRTMAVLMIPVALIAPLIVAWVTGMSLPGRWSGPLDGAYLVVSTLLSGSAVLIVVLAALRRGCGLSGHLDRGPFVALGWLLAGLALATAALGAGVGIHVLFAGMTASPGWTYTAGLLLPVAVMLLRPLRRVGFITAAAAVAAVWMAFERYALVVGGLTVPGTPVAFGPTLVELLVTAGVVALFVMLLAGATKLVPAIAVWEVGEQERPEPARRLSAVKAGRVTAAVIVALIVWQGTALAHPQREPVEEEPPPVAPEPEAAVPDLRLYPPLDGVLGEENLIEAVLLAPDGAPISDATITFTTTAYWGTYVHGDVVIGSARTDERGFARIETELRRAGHVGLGAQFAGNADFQPASASSGLSVYGTTQLYAPEQPAVGWGVWWLAAALAVIWLVLLLMAVRVLAIARSTDGDTRVGRCPFSGRGGGAGDGGPEHGRRHFLARYLVPAGMAAVVASAGSGVLGLLGRSARASARPAEQRPPVAYAGTWSRDLRPLPPLLEREVSFADDVLPILRRRGGPHVHRPEHSPVPFHVHLDSYEGVMEGHTSPGHEMAHDLVVPGDPEASRLVTVLRDPAMQMPPGVPLPDEEVQLIASWVAQGAKEN